VGNHVYYYAIHVDLVEGPDGRVLTSSPPWRARAPSGRLTGSRLTAFTFTASQLAGAVRTHPAPLVQR